MQNHRPGMDSADDTTKITQIHHHLFDQTTQIGQNNCDIYVLKRPLLGVRIPWRRRRGEEGKKKLFSGLKSCVCLLLSSNCASARRRLIMAVVHSRNFSKTTFLDKCLIELEEVFLR